MHINQVMEMLLLIKWKCIFFDIKKYNNYNIIFLYIFINITKW